MCFRIIVTTFLSFIWSCYSFAIPAISSSQVSLPDYWGEKNVWWDGRTSFTGRVYVESCSLEMNDQYQVLYMGVEQLKNFHNSDIGLEKKLKIELKNCDFPSDGQGVFSNSRVQVTFDGMPGNSPDQFYLNGQAKGIALQIVNSDGYSAIAGKPLPAEFINSKRKELIYTARLVRNGEALKPGNYQALIGFKLNYN
ncbi:fimbrial protein [Edwardsiella tarda]|uniref:fimbrial protein n=1 Tax=Edwardsiella tarda TaxID=636 RepID=UPI0034DD9BE5